MLSVWGCICHRLKSLLSRWFLYSVFSNLPLKMMENALDTLRTAFPNPDLLSPTEDIEGDADGRAMENRKYRWALNDLLYNIFSQEEKLSKNLHSWFLNNVVFHVLCFRRLFSSKISPSLNISDLHPKVTYCFSEGSTVSYHAEFSFLIDVSYMNETDFCSVVTAQVLNGTSLSGLESFIREQERLLCGSNGIEKAKRSCELHSNDNKMTGKTLGTGRC